MEIGKKIRELRIARNLTQEALAAELSVTPQAISKWECGTTTPDIQLLPDIAIFFGVTLDELVRGEDAPQSEPAAAEVQNDPSSFAPQTVPARDKSRSIIGTVLLCTGAVIVLLFLLLFGSIFSGLLFGAPFFICGVICLTAKSRVGLWCGWAVYACVDLYLRFATGLSWTTIFMTRIWTPEMNYMRLAISWVQLLGMLVMIVWTVCSYRALKLNATKKEITWLAAGWFAALVALPLLMSYGVMPLLLDDLGNYSNISPYFLLNVVYSYARLALINVLLVRSLAVWRLKREEKKAEK